MCIRDSFTAAPVLVFSGDMDTLTPAIQGSEAAAQYAHAQHVLVANTFHVSALGDEDDCAQALVRTFVGSLNPGDTSCAAEIAEARVFPKFALTAAEVAGATPLSGNEGTAGDLSVAAVAAYTVGDALDTWWVNYSGTGVGLRGGTFTYTSMGNLTLFSLDHMKWTNDVEVSGSFTWDYYKPGAVIAQLTLTGDSVTAGALQIQFNSREPLAQASITGQIDGRSIVATMYAP